MKRTVAGLLILLVVISIPFALRMPTGGSRPGGSGSRGNIALADLTGMITTQSSSQQLGVERLVSFLQEVRKRDDIEAVVLRVDSGGGSAAASQEVHRAIVKLREAGKPVVVSMGEIAASGGYYVSVAADRILANPSTLTGSIGVISQFINLAEFADRHGFHFETVATGPYKDLGNPLREMTDAEREILQELVEDSLDQFVEAIAEGRGLSIEEVRDVADGRIITGRQAYELGLIDDFGGLEDAITLAAELAGIEGEPRIVRQARPPASLAERLLGIQSLDDGIIERLLGNMLIDRVLRGGDHLIISY